MKYFEILPECPAYEPFVGLFTSSQKWYEKDVVEKIESLLGVKIENNLGITELALYLVNVPDDLKNQFCNAPLNNGLYKAKANSKINRAYVKLAKELGLHKVRTYEVNDALQLPFSWGKGGYHFLLNRCILSMTRSRWSFTVSGVKEISEEDYFLLQAANAAKKGEAS